MGTEAGTEEEEDGPASAVVGVAVADGGGPGTTRQSSLFPNLFTKR